ncbi:hypothetical protein HPB50_021578 [Hyalomma asiaticum]|uniref:Uncharacterized protein n=1 Tax=Hyalomma asiaticum TaxID=266040 RepID=A0ACB7T4C5_HYAAI|nr:hypothetical protein HPB50_021578 [Hyalomma asiaticum]
MKGVKRRTSEHLLTGPSPGVYVVDRKADERTVDAKLRAKTAALTDERIRLVNEFVAGMRVIKMYTWEMPFAQLVNNMRNSTGSGRLPDFQGRILKLMATVTIAGRRRLDYHTEIHGIRTALERMAAAAEEQVQVQQQREIFQELRTIRAQTAGIGGALEKQQGGQD